VGRADLSSQSWVTLYRSSSIDVPRNAFEKDGLSLIYFGVPPLIWRPVGIMTKVRSHIPKCHGTFPPLPSSQPILLCDLWLIDASLRSLNSISSTTLCDYLNPHSTPLWLPCLFATARTIAAMIWLCPDVANEAVTEHRGWKQRWGRCDHLPEITADDVQLLVWWLGELEEGEAGLEILGIEAGLPHSLYYKLEKIFYKLASICKKFRKFSVGRGYCSI